jgi:hypothetical protein
MENEGGLLPVLVTESSAKEYRGPPRQNRRKEPTAMSSLYLRRLKKSSRVLKGIEARSRKVESGRAAMAKHDSRALFVRNDNQQH